MQKLLQQLKSGFKRIINWNKYLSNPGLSAQNPNLNHSLHWVYHDQRHWLHKHCNSVNCVNPLYLITEKTDGYIEESNGNKYFIFASTDKKKKVWQNT